MSKKRLFIAINLPAQIKDVLAKALESAEPLPENRFTPRENLHFTVVFLGYQDEAQEQIIAAQLKKVASSSKPVTITLTEIQYGPPGPSARMIWVYGESKGLSEIKEKTEESLAGAQISFAQDHRIFHPHITLARFQKPLSAKFLAPLSIPLQISFSAESLDLMESKLNRDGSTYSVLASYNLAGAPN